jgi:hypothetical protein
MTKMINLAGLETIARSRRLSKEEISTAMGLLKQSAIELPCDILQRQSVLSRYNWDNWIEGHIPVQRINSIL